MKILILLVAGLLSAGSAFGQGTVIFANTGSPDYRLLTNNGSASGLMAGTNQWRIGLYVGSSESSLVLVGLTTNAANPAVAGYFSGGNPFFLPSPYGVGDRVTFQVRAWASAGGLTHTEALLGGSLVGMSSLGFVTLGGGIDFPGPLFGTNPGQIGGFTIGIPEPSSFPLAVPEPATYALGLLGVVLFGLLRRRRR